MQLQELSLGQHPGQHPQTCTCKDCVWYREFEKERLRPVHIINRGDVFQTSDHQAADLALLWCSMTGIEVAGVDYYLNNDRFSKGEKIPVQSIMHPTTLLNFNAYKKAVKALTWRNRTQQHSNNGTKAIIITSLFRNLLSEKYGDGSATSDYSTTGFDLCVNPSIKDSITRYYSPSVLVGAGFTFGMQVPDGKNALKVLTSHFTELHTGFSTTYHNGTHIHLLDGLFTIIQNGDYISVEARIEKEQRHRKHNLGYYVPQHIWRGKACDFANFISIVEKAFEALHGQPQRLYSTGGSVFDGLHILFYDVRTEEVKGSDLGCGELTDVKTKIPHDYMELISQTFNYNPKKNALQSETRVYGGNEVPLEMLITGE